MLPLQEEWSHDQSKTLKLNQKEEKNVNKNEKNDTVATATDDDVLVVCDQNVVNLTCQESILVIDNGASIHCTLKERFLFILHVNSFRCGQDGKQWSA